jgi:Fe2+ or Zn2+ uptake regulation protein
MNLVKIMNRRHSIQKQLILDALKVFEHPMAQQVLQEVQKQYPHMSRGTVYRNLNLLVEDGALRRLSFPDSPDRFDIQTHSHDHVQCTCCGKIFDIEPDCLKEIDREIERGTDFSIEGHSITFQGVYPWCQQGKHK